MSYIVPKAKPNKCTNCIYMDRITYDCKLMYGDDYPDFEIQYKNCPLIEVSTPHGRLIDADKLNGRLVLHDNSPEHAQLYANICEWIDLQETVIEAEGSEE